MKNILFLVVLVLTTSCSLFKQTGPATKNVNGMEFATVTLPNKLEVLLVHDTRFKKSSAAMAVMVGSLEDPQNNLGMAHYLEHMLFLGTKAFPEPSEYSTYMETNGGWDNAYTDDEITNYMFEVDSAAMEGAIQRFSRFFVEPLFNEKFLDREKNAVNSEFEKNLKSDSWRMQRYTNLLAKDGHPYGKFTIGNTKTLAPVTRTDVVNFYSKYYSSNNMKLVIMSSQPMANLLAWTNKYFSDVPNFNVQRPKYDENMFENGAKNRLHFIKAIEDNEEMSVLFNIPDDKGYWATKPVEILSAILGHEGKGSLLSYLTEKGWALKLSAGHHVWGTFGLNLTLTPAGRANYDKVLTAVFQYIDLVKSKGYTKEIFEDEKAMRIIDLENLEPSASGGRAASFARQMTDYPVDEFLERYYLIKDYSKEDFEKFLSYLKADNVHVVIASKGEKTNKKEDIFGIEYASQPLVIKTDSPAPSFSYPERNKYIPTDFSLFAKNNYGEPKKIEVKDKGEVYFRQDTDLGFSKGFVYVDILSDVPNTPLNDVLNSLFERCKTEELREWSYPIGQARYNYYLQAVNGDQMSLTISGYTQRLNTVLKDIIFDKENQRRISELKIDEKTFNDVKAKYKKDLLNINETMAAQRLGMELSQLMTNKGLPWQDTLEQIDKVKVKDVQDFAKKFFANINVRIVAYGNVKEDEYPAMVDYIFSSLAATPLEASVVQAKRAQFRIVPDGKNYSMLIKGKNNNNAMMAIYKMNDWSLDNMANMAVLNQVLSQPYFSELRTNQQLGYIANGGGSGDSGYVGIYGMLQSGKYSSKELYERSDKFLKEFLQDKAEKITDADLRPVKASLVTELTTKPNTLRERYEQFKKASMKYDGQFDMNKNVAEKVKTIDVNGFKQFIKSNFFDREPARLTLYYVNDTSKLTKKDLPGTVFEKPDEIRDWVVTDPYKQTVVK